MAILRTCLPCAEDSSDELQFWQWFTSGLGTVTGASIATHAPLPLRESVRIVRPLRAAREPFRLSGRRPIRRVRPLPPPPGVDAQALVGAARKHLPSAASGRIV
ncbi:hypothetical protein ACFW2I_36895 [Streptomyces nigra]|uniref:hypothetical protein n=1 Tax=Streptomyces nigra TaxID=1827580 RepID=UPI00369D0EEF